MKTATEAMETIRESAKTNANSEVRDCTAMVPGDEPVRQGDVNIFCIPKVPEIARRAKNPSAQVAPGNTRGSRHRIREIDKVTLYEIDLANPLQGPIIEAPNGFHLDHGDGAADDHATCRFGPGVYMVGYQRDYAQDLRRVAD